MDQYTNMTIEEKELLEAYDECVFNPKLLKGAQEMIGSSVIEDIVLGTGYASSSMLVQSSVIRILLGAGKTITTLYEWKKVSNIISFIIGIQHGTLDENAARRHRQKLENDPRKLKREVSKVLLLVDRATDNKKATILGKLYKAFIEERIGWNDFCEYAFVTEQIFLTDISLLMEVDKDNKKFPDREYSYRGNRLNSLGLIETIPASVLATVGNINIERELRITQFGRNYVLNGLDGIELSKEYE